MDDADPQDPRPTERVFVSACLLGRRCKYDGGDNRDRLLEEQLASEGLEAVPFCPEEAGGLGTPRPAAWLTEPAARVADGEGQVVTEEGRDVTAEFLAGARAAVELCRAEGLRRAFLKERSPSCGCRQTHVGDSVVPGPGLTAQLLGAAGVACTGVEGRRVSGSERADREL